MINVAAAKGFPWGERLSRRLVGFFSAGGCPDQSYCGKPRADVSHLGDDASEKRVHALCSGAQDDLCPVVGLVAEIRISLGRAFKGQTVADEEGRIDLPVADPLQ